MGTTRIRRIWRVAILVASAGALQPSLGWAQADRRAVPAPTPVTQQPNAQRTREEFSALLDQHPPGLRGVLALDPSLLDNRAYLAPYPAVASFLDAHPEIARNPSFYVGSGAFPRANLDRGSQILQLWGSILAGAALLTGFTMAVALLAWLIRTLIDYRRWSTLSRVQTEVHTKLIDRFTANEDLLAYIHSAPGARFLESSPITLDASPRSVGAPMARILWSVQGGVVLAAAGIGLLVVSGRVGDVASEPLRALGILAIALGLGFMISAIISYVLSRRLGLIEPPPASQSELPGA